VDPDVKRLFEEFKQFNDALVSRVEGGMRAVLRTLEAQTQALVSLTESTGDMIDELKVHREALFLILDEIRGAQGGA
jgi:hypothetical protein